MAKQYVVELTEDERSQLQGIGKKGKVVARRLRRAQLLLLAAGGYTDTDIAAVLHVGVSTVERIRKRFVEGGIEWALTEGPRPGGTPKLQGKDEAFLIATACSTPPSGRTHWTLQLLADRLVEVGVVETISDETIRRTLKKTRSSRG